MTVCFWTVQNKEQRQEQWLVFLCLLSAAAVRNDSQSVSLQAVLFCMAHDLFRDNENLMMIYGQLGSCSWKVT